MCAFVTKLRLHPAGLEPDARHSALTHALRALSAEVAFAGVVRIRGFVEVRVHDFRLSVPSGTRGQNKNRQSIRTAVCFSGGDFRRVFLPHIGGNFRSRSKHRGSPPARLPDSFGVIPDVHQNGIIITRICNWIFALPAPFHARARARGSATLRNR